MRTTVGLGAGLFFGIGLATCAWAQAPQGTSFTYQGRLTESGALASGAYDLQFALYDAPAGGAQVGPTVAFEDVAVTEGLFTVSLDFGNVFGGEKRFLELGVRPGADTGAFTPIQPRQELTPGPAAIFSAAAADAQNLGGVPASQFVVTDDPRMTDARTPLAGSPDYVQNGSVAQPGVSFNVGGTGTADVLDAATQFNLAGARILARPGTSNLFVGINAGAGNTTGFGNSFFGESAGQASSTGTVNSFFGHRAGVANEGGSFNAFFGTEAGMSNVTGNGNAYLGRDAGRTSTTGSANTFVGRSSGINNTIGAGNTAVGFFAGFGAPGLSNATAIGANAVVNASDTMVLGTPSVTVQVPGSQTVAGNVGVGGAVTVTGAVGAGSFDAQAQYNLGGGRILGAPGTSNLFAGLGAGASNAGVSNAFFGPRAGQANTTGDSNAFFGTDAGLGNTSGDENAFFGFIAGRANSGGGFNSFFGSRAGQANTTGGGNAFFGSRAGEVNATGGDNAFIGAAAGLGNTTGSANSFVGSGAGLGNTTGIKNSFFGFQSGFANSTGQQNAYFGDGSGCGDGSFNSAFGQGSGSTATGGNNVFMGWFAGGSSNGFANTFVGNLAGGHAVGSGNTFIGTQASVDFAAGTNSLFNTLLGGNALVAPNVSNSTAIGNRATVTQSNSLVLGSIFGVNTGQDTKVGIGTTAPQARLHVVDSGDILFGRSLGCLAATVAGIAFAPTIANSCANYALYGGDGNTYVARPTGGTLTFREGATTQVSIRPGGFLNLTTLGTAGTTALCRNTTGDISTCSSSLRYKEDVASFGGGLDVVERLRPIRFTWKASGQPDIGLAAEEVAEVEPLLAFKNGNGEIEGVNYAQLTAVLVNALQQQQSQIEALKALVCEANPKEPPCAK